MFKPPSLGPLQFPLVLSLLVIRLFLLLRLLLPLVLFLLFKAPSVPLKRIVRWAEPPAPSPASSGRRGKRERGPHPPASTLHPPASSLQPPPSTLHPPPSTLHPPPSICPSVRPSVRLSSCPSASGLPPNHRLPDGVRTNACFCL